MMRREWLSVARFEAVARDLAFVAKATSRSVAHPGFERLTGDKPH
jgi:hypothetical protein